MDSINIQKAEPGKADYREDCIALLEKVEARIVDAEQTRDKAEALAVDLKARYDNALRILALSEQSIADFQGLRIRLEHRLNKPTVN